MNIIEFPMKCGICSREIPEGGIYLSHPKYGKVCEYCPQFNCGNITIDELPTDRRG